jgi:hypothetical protein
MTPWMFSVIGAIACVRTMEIDAQPSGWVDPAGLVPFIEITLSPH